MHVLHVIPAVAPRYGGPSSTIVSMCRALEGAGVSTVIATTDADGPSHLDVPLDTRSSWNGLNTWFFHRQWSEAFKYSQPLAQWLDAHVPDFTAVHVHGLLSHASLAAARAAARHSVPYIVRPLGTLDTWSLAQKPWRKQLLLRVGGLQALKSAAAVQYTSIGERRQVEGALKVTRGVVIPLGVDADLLSDAGAGDTARAGRRYVLALCRLHPVKNLETLIEAFADATGDGPGAGWALEIAGDGDHRYAERLTAVIRQRDAASRIRLSGWIDGAAKRALFQGASLFAMPSLHENFGVSIVEAMAVGVPVIVSDRVHLAETIRGAGAGWVAGPDRTSLAAVLREAMTRDEDRERFGLAARTLAARFSWPAIARELADLYASVTTSRAQLASRPGSMTGSLARASGAKAAAARAERT